MYFIITAFVLLAAYIVLLAVEARRGTRLLEEYRARLDRLAERTSFILAHVDLKSFIREEAIRIARTSVHILAREALSAVRAAERLLTRLVRHLRLHHEVERRPSGESSRSFVRTLSEFKGQLEATRPELTEIR